MSDFTIGDIIQLHGPHPTLPKELEEKFWRVIGIEDPGVQLDGPYDDRAATIKYRPKPPRRKP